MKHVKLADGPDIIYHEMSAEKVFMFVCGINCADLCNKHSKIPIGEWESWFEGESECPLDVKEAIVIALIKAIETHPETMNVVVEHFITNVLRGAPMCRPDA